MFNIKLSTPWPLRVMMGYAMVLTGGGLTRHLIRTSQWFYCQKRYKRIRQHVDKLICFNQVLAELTARPIPVLWL